jgi:hypothetical protein
MSEIPQSLVDRMLEQASDLSGMPASDLAVEGAEAVTWPDGSLGCPEPGMMYTQVLVDGYWVVIRAGAETYDFRASGSDFKLCPPSRNNPRAHDGDLPPDRTY